MLLKAGKAKIYRLRDIRQQKLNRLVIKIKKVKHQLQCMKEDINKLRQEVKDYKKDRLQFQMELRDEYLETKHSDIQTLINYQAANTKLLKGEKQINNKIITLNSDIEERKSAIKNLHEKLLRLNKKIEGLNKIIE